MAGIPADVVAREQRKREMARARRARYEARTGRVRHDVNEARPDGHERSYHYRDYPFRMWDGEAPKDTGYSLFGSSAGHEVCKPHLTTEDCFDLLLQAKADDPHCIDFWYGGRYDWDEITRQSLPWDRLSRLKQGQVVHWHGYRLSELEGKIYEVAKDNVTVRIFDVTSWFHCSYVAALRKYGIRTTDCGHGKTACESECACSCALCRMQSDKNRRGDFHYREIADIARYMHSELQLGPELMNVIRKICLDAGFDPRGWYGPSALARQLLTRNKVKDYMAECPKGVNDAACYAFAGGRFEGFRGGILPDSITADQNSAYMHAALNLPCLAHGSWRQGKAYEAHKFALYHIRYADRSKPFDVSKPYPLFRRLPNGNVCWPRRVDGWYWAPEAELVADDPAATFIESWVFDEGCTHRPFAFVLEMFRKRLVMQGLDNPAEMAFKWALASIYGQLARAVGWNKRTRKPPVTHQIEWAGYITSACRAEMFKLAKWAGDRLVSIDTDSVTWMGSATPDYLPLGQTLGQWKLEKSKKSVVFQNGVYFTHDGTAWSAGKTRGMERQRGTPAVTPEMLIEAIRENKAVKLHPKRKYVTVRMALNGQLLHAGEWLDHPGNTLFFGGGGKRYHNLLFCQARCSGEIHIFMPKPAGFDTGLFDIQSVAHYLPWKNGRRPLAEDDTYLEDILWIDTGNLDSEDEWMATLIPGRDKHAAEQQATKNSRVLHSVM
jgi:hypothetical protein